jgi:hypothetical protein
MKTLNESELTNPTVELITASGKHKDEPRALIKPW